MGHSRLEVTIRQRKRVNFTFTIFRLESIVFVPFFFYKYCGNPVNPQVRISGLDYTQSQNRYRTGYNNNRNCLLRAPCEGLVCFIGLFYEILVQYE